MTADILISSDLDDRGLPAAPVVADPKVYEGWATHPRHRTTPHIAVKHGPRLYQLYGRVNQRWHWGDTSPAAIATARAILWDLLKNAQLADRLAPQFANDFLLLYHPSVNWEIKEEDIREWLPLQTHP